MTRAPSSRSEFPGMSQLPKARTSSSSRRTCRTCAWPQYRRCFSCFAVLKAAARTTTCFRHSSVARALVQLRDHCFLFCVETSSSARVSHRASHQVVNVGARSHRSASSARASAVNGNADVEICDARQAQSTRERVR